MSTTEPDASVGWIDLCINVPKPENSVYSYCDDRFDQFTEKTTCKLDLCRICCVSSDTIHNTKSTDKNLDECFKKCGKTFVLNPSREAN